MRIIRCEHSLTRLTLSNSPTFSYVLHSSLVARFQMLEQEGKPRRWFVRLSDVGGERCWINIVLWGMSLRMAQ